jgi:hypothetical protein
MPTYTPSVLRAYIDDMDTIIREAIMDGTIKGVFARERNAAVSFFYYF